METTAFQGDEIKWAGPEPGTLKSTGRVSSKTFLCGNFFPKERMFFEITFILSADNQVDNVRGRLSFFA